VGGTQRKDGKKANGFNFHLSATEWGTKEREKGIKKNKNPPGTNNSKATKGRTRKALNLNGRKGEKRLGRGNGSTKPKKKKIGREFQRSNHHQGRTQKWKKGKHGMWATPSKL